MVIKQFPNWICYFFASVLFASPVYAADGLYIGIQGGVMNNDRSSFDSAANLGVTVGYEFLGVVLGDIAVEGGYTNTASSGNAPGGEWKIETLAAYGVFRTAGPIYLKAKAGAARSDVDALSSSSTSTDFSAGLGGGFSAGIAQVELEYTFVSEEVDFISLTVNIKTPF